MALLRYRIAHGQLNLNPVPVLFRPYIDPELAIEQKTQLPMRSLLTCKCELGLIPVLSWCYARPSSIAARPPLRRF
jgi:hypothetical protein